MGIASSLCAWLEHWRLWLWRPMREWQYFLQVLHVYAVCWTELTQSFLRARLSVAACVSFSSPVLRCLVTAPLHCDRSAARFSQVSVSMPTAFMSRFTTSRYRSCGRPVRLLPVASSPYSKSLRMPRPSGMQWTWPSQQSLRCLSKVNMLGRPARDRTFVFGTLSCHEIPRKFLIYNPNKWYSREIKK